LHALLQQTPSTQLFDAHSVAALHVVPIAFLQVPSDPVRLQAEPGVVHETLQQTLFAQTLFVH
jgi:hypothetical protein